MSVAHPVFIISNKALIKKIKQTTYRSTLIDCLSISVQEDEEGRIKKITLDLLSIAANFNN